MSFEAIGSALSTAIGSSYVNDFPNGGRLQRVVVQADAPARMQGSDLLRINVLNNRGQAVPLSSFASSKWIVGPMQTIRYNGYSAMRLSGEAAAGYSSGAAMAEMERLAGQLPTGFGFEWTGQSREERLAGSQAFILFGFALLAVFLALAALYESWSIPLAVILVVPLGVLGVLLGSHARGLSNDVYFNVGLITIIGLGAKNAVLIIEFAKDLQAQGKSVIEAVLEAAHLRFRPIVMTSMAFILGVLPLVLASWRGFGQPARDRHRRDVGHAGGHHAGGVLRADLLRRGAAHLQGQRAAAPHVRPRSPMKPIGRATACPHHRHQRDTMNPMIRMTSSPRTSSTMPAVVQTGARWLTTALAAAVLAGCGSLIPAYERPQAPVAAQFPVLAAEDAGTASIAAPDLAWQDFFQDARLKQLITIALDNNRDLRVAALNLEQARAQLQMRRADEVPTVGVGASGSRHPTPTAASATPTAPASRSPVTRPTSSAACAT